MRRFSSLSVWIQAAVATMLATACTAQTRTLTLEHAVRLALEHNRGIEQAFLTEQAAGERIDIARTRRLPSFKFSSTSGMLLTRPTVTFEEGAFGNFTGIGPVPGKSTQITSARKPAAMITAEAAMPLTQQFRIGLEIRLAELSRKTAHQQLRLTRQQVVQQIRETYYAILQAQSSLEAVEHSLALYRELSETTGRYVKAGTALDADLLSVNTRLAQAEFDKAALEGPLATQKERLNLLLGRSIETEFQVSPAVEAGWTPLLGPVSALPKVSGSPVPADSVAQGAPGRGGLPL